MNQLTKIVDFLGRTLDHDNFGDASLNGLQVEGSQEVSKICVAVDAAQATIEACRAEKAQLLLVHHGLFWGKPLAICGSTRERIKTLLDADISLFASHLPLDAHPLYGNNAQLCDLLGITERREVFEYGGRKIGIAGANGSNRSLRDICECLQQLRGADEKVFHLAFGPDTPERIAICSGSASDGLARFAEDNFDTLITGEAKQAAYHEARDNNLNVVFAGHYASETLGVEALGKLLQETFSVPYTFIDHPTGI